MQADPLLPHKTTKKHPFESSNVISKVFFCWLLPFFIKGYKHNLTEDDMLGCLQAHESGRLGDQLETAWSWEVTNKDKPSLLRILVKVFYKELGFYGIFLLIQEFIIKLSQPILISKFLKFYEPEQLEVTREETYIYASLIVIFALLNVMFLQGYYFGVMHLGMKLRVATCSLIYRKSLKLNRYALANTTVGQMVNLLSNDAGKFDMATQYIHYFWLAPLETVVVMYLLYIYVGLAGLTGALFLTLFIFPQRYLGKRLAQCRSKTAKKTDERIRLMSEIITGVQVIKMYAWENAFAKLIALSRKKEMKEISATSTVRAIMTTCLSVLHRSAIYLCIITYVLTGNILTASYTYTVASFYAVLRQGVTMYLPRAIAQYAEASTSVKRIQAFLLLEELTQNEENNNMGETDTDSNVNSIQTPKKEIGIYLKNVTVKWDNELLENCLENVDFDVTRNQIVAVVGKVGGGKSALLNTILRELVPLTGAINVVGAISYCSQEPWIFTGSVKQNIIFGQKFIEDKYHRVINVCALEADLKSFPNSDETLVGERGVTLSGGQKARINLARAVYREADIYLLDDPFPSVDSHVGKHIFEHCIQAHLKNKCVVLVTNHIQYLQGIEKIYLLHKGKIQAVGSYQNLKETESDFHSILTECENRESLKLDSAEIEKRTNDKKISVVIPTPSKEQTGTGKISMDVYKIYFKAGGNLCKSGMILFMFVVAQFFAVSSDYFVTLWVNLEQWRIENNNINNLLLNNATNVFTNHNTSENQPENSLFVTMDNIFTEDMCLCVYSTFLLLSIIFTVTRSLSFFRFCMTSSRNLHSVMFNSVIKTPITFFNMNPSGRILNRFSKDIGTIDETLPATISDTLQIAFILLSVSIVIGFLNPWILCPTIIIVVIFYLLRLVFLATSRNIKRIEAVARSPIYTHLTASIAGIATIRAFGAQGILIDEFDSHQNKYSTASFLFMGANRTFGFWLDFLCIIYTALVIISILFIQSEIFGGNVGFALTETVGLIGMFQFGIRQWSLMENQMTAVERVQEYIEIRPEYEKNYNNPPKSWPSQGHIKFSKLSLRYSDNSPYVLENISFEIKSKEKIGIVGRTGAGKSSLIVALLRLVDTDGRITIDNVDINEINLSTLRSNISIIPQDPVLFSGTLRMNLDPFYEFDDAVLWKALEDVELKKAIMELPKGLSFEISEGGTNFSVGQRQLMCLARAIIRYNKILILDEATANVDPYTERLIQKTIRKKFIDCTVLTIAHRLQNIMDSDRVLVMDSGTVAEFDSPEVLLENQNGMFYKLVREAGLSVNKY